MPRPNKIPARERLLQAAACVFARDGLAGSTTRAIAKEACVNEVTLFRLFGSKDRLLSEVVEKLFPFNEPNSPIFSATGDLSKDLLAYARLYALRLTENLSLIRTLIGEIHHEHMDQERQVFRGIFRPLRASLIALLNEAQSKRKIRAELNAEILTDLFNGMIFTDVIRRSSSHSCPSYSPDDNLKAAVNLLLYGSTRGGRT